MNLEPTFRRAIEREGAECVPDPAVRWGLGEYVVAQAPSIVFIALIFLSREYTIELPHLVVVIAPPVAYGFSLAVVWWSSRRRGLRRLDNDFGWAFKPVDLALGIGLLAGMLLFEQLLGAVLRSVGLPPPDSNITLPPDPFIRGFTGFVVPVLLAAPIEELVFRGLLMRSIRNRILRSSSSGVPSLSRRRAAIWFSIGISSAVFMLAHLYEAANLVTLISLGAQTLVFGIAAGWIDTRTGRLGPSIITHALQNAIVFAVQTRQS